MEQGWVYTLLLQDRKIYVGWTAHDNLARRIAQHFCGNGAKWTTRHRPLTVLAVIEGGKPLECATTAALMARYGVDFVRVGGWCRLELAEPDWFKQAKYYKNGRRKTRRNKKGGEEPNKEP